MRVLEATEIAEAWLALVGASSTENRTRAVLQEHVLKVLSEGRPVSPRGLASRTGTGIEEVEAMFDQLRGTGVEFNEEGDLTGVALTLNPTAHRFTADGHELYAWCSLDTLFLPGLIGKTAEIASRCPVTGRDIRVTASPGQIDYADPPEAVLSIFVPGVTMGDDVENVAGRDGAVCTSMNFSARGRLRRPGSMVRPTWG
jgi:alkylmercury lyase